jgi:hypothetical protein
MSDWVGFFLTTLALFAVVITITGIVQKRKRSLRYYAKEQGELDKLLACHNAEEAEWKKKVAAARHLLAGETWCDSQGKAEFCKRLFGDAVPRYLWYSLCLRTEELSRDDFEEIRSYFWDEKAGFGDFEFHKSQNLELGTVIRIRNAKRFAPHVVLGGKRCPLCQIGYSDFGDANPSGVVYFPALFKNEPATV